MGEKYLSKKLQAKRIIDDKINHAVVFAHRGQYVVARSIYFCFDLYKIWLLVIFRTYLDTYATRPPISYEFYSRHQ